MFQSVSHMTQLELQRNSDLFSIASCVVLNNGSKDLSLKSWVVLSKFESMSNFFSWPLVTSVLILYFLRGD